jgi:intein-encoded DNA endonuclease-like protein
LYDDIREKERAEALLRFIGGGGAEADFEFKGDEYDVIFDANLKLIKDRRAQFFKQQEEDKGENLRKKEELLEKLRVLSDSQDTSDQFERFKELQKEWKTIGPVPGAQAKTLWANYHALTDRFYDNQSIYFELKELDRRKNLEAKLELCARAEKLASIELIKDAIQELNELHHEFKHLGPVPKEDKEAVWHRFKGASDAVYARRDAYLQNLQQELQDNLSSKASLSDEVQEFVNFQSDRIKEWNQKTKDILELQKRWELVGGLPRAKAKDVNKKFWSAFKTFFNNKNAFFKKLDEERELNLQLKNDLVKKAVELKESNDWERTSNELKTLQQKWKDVGPVPEKFREKVFKEFKDACDHFFEQRRTQHDKMEQEQTENLRLKEEICTELESHAAGRTGSSDILRELQEKFSSIGFVPRKDINTIRTRYHEAVERFINSIPGLTDDEKGKITLENQLNDLRNDPMADRKIFQKEQIIRKKISKVENDIALWRNNLEFFGRSKNADKVKDEFNDKIKEATDHLKQLKEQLKLLKTV